MPRAKITRGDCEALDRSDRLSAFRDRFALPENLIYLDGNSLGAMPKAAPARIAEVVEQEWGNGLVRSWNIHGWAGLQQRIGEKIGRLIGARPGETLVADSTSVNLFKMLSVALQARPDRRIILSESSNFPTDLYIAEGMAHLLGKHHQLRALASDAIEGAIDEHVAVVMLTHVNYRTGRMWDMARITERAHAHGAIMLWDLAHSAGAVKLALHEADVDLAVGCGYKYLNGGPGAPAFLFIAERLHAVVSPALSGWFGHADPFAFEPAYRPAPGIARAAVGTPPIISLAALEVGVDLMLEVSQDEMRRKSVALSSLFIDLADQQLGALGFTLVSPREAAQRGSQVCLSHPSAWPIMQALIAHGVIGDFRAPDILRFGFTPLYLRYVDVWDAVMMLTTIMESREWTHAKYQVKTAVT
jgi:kynureninase